jgi:HSP20 family protein
LGVTELLPKNWKSSIEGLRESINNAFERYLSKVKRKERGEQPFWSPTVVESSTNGIDLDETDNEIIARLAVPGVDKGDLKVEITQDRLVIRGDKIQSRKKENRGYFHYEESHASFAQAIALPCEIDRDRAKARYKNGLLIVTMPKDEKSKSKRIKIAVNG